MLSPRSVLLPLAVVMVAVMPVGAAWAGPSSTSAQSQKQVSTKRATHHRLITTTLNLGTNRTRVRVNYRRYAFRPVPHSIVKSGLSFSLDRVVSDSYRPKDESSKEPQSIKMPENDSYQNGQQSVAQKPAK